MYDTGFVVPYLYALFAPVPFTFRDGVVEVFVYVNFTKIVTPAFNSVKVLHSTIF